MSDSIPHDALNVIVPRKVIDNAIQEPAPVQINVQGAFIVDENAINLRVDEVARPVHRSKDIRLPHHTEVVSHVAVDVRSASWSCEWAKH